MNIPLGQFQQMAAQLKSNLHGDYEPRPDNVYLEGEGENRKIIGTLLDKLIKPGSGLKGTENFKRLYKYSKKGKACLLLVEHYSNLDYPALYHLVESEPGLGPDAASAMLPIQGMKLSAFSDLTAAFTNSYSTIVIYPSRGIDSEKDPQKRAEIRKTSLPINHAAMRELTRRKYHGNIIVVFPAGTRYRPWDADSKKGVREIYSYLKAFDYVCFVSINGNLLVPCKEDDMEKDVLREDIILFSFSKPVKGKEFREKKTREAPPGTDPKQYVVDQVMARLDKFHQKAELIRQEIIQGLP